MKTTRILYTHLAVGLIYIILTAVGTRGVSGGDISYWVFLSFFLVIHLIIILLIKSKSEGFKAWVLILALAIVTSLILEQVYLNRDHAEGVDFNDK